MPINEVQDALENYIIKNNKYEKTRNEEPHYKDRSLSEQKELDNSFSELNNLYNSLSRENQQKTKRPIYPLMPYIKIMKDGKKYYKKESELTKEDWALLPPPPPPPVMSQDMINTGSKELQKANKKLLEEAKSYGLAVRNQKGTAKNNNEINVKYKKTMELYKVYRELAIAEGFLPTPPPPPPAPANKTDHIIEWAKRGALFYYEDKKITSDKAIEITKKNSSINIETLGTGSRKPIVKLSKKPITVEK